MMLLFFIARCSSFGAWCGLIIALIIMSDLFKYGRVIFQRKPLLLFFFMVLMVIFLQYVNDVDVRDVLIDLGSSWQSRLEIWNISLNLALKNIVTGIGPDNHRAYMTALLGIPFPHPHNIFLLKIVESGLAALLLFISIIYYFLKYAYEIYLKIKTQERYFVLGIIGGMCSCLVHGMVDCALVMDQMQVLFWGCLAIIMFLKKYYEINKYLKNESLIQ